MEQWQVQPSPETIKSRDVVYANKTAPGLVTRLAKPGVAKGHPNRVQTQWTRTADPFDDSPMAAPTSASAPHPKDARRIIQVYLGTAISWSALVAYFLLAASS